MTLNDKILSCTKCSIRELCPQPMVGTGKTSSKIVIISGNFDKDENLTVDCYYGRANKNFRNLLNKTIGVDNVYFTSLVKCFVPQGRSPTQHEISNCEEYLWKEIEENSPKVIVTLGAIPLRHLLKLKKVFKLSEYVGKQYQTNYMSHLIMPWYSTSYVLQRGKAAQESTINFLQKVQNVANN